MALSPPIIAPLARSVKFYEGRAASDLTEALTVPLPPYSTLANTVVGTAMRVNQVVGLEAALATRDARRAAIRQAIDAQEDRING